MLMPFQLGRKVVRLGLLLLVTLILEMSAAGYASAHVDCDQPAESAHSQILVEQGYIPDVQASATSFMQKVTEAATEVFSDCCCSDHPGIMPLVVPSAKDDGWLFAPNYSILFYISSLAEFQVLACLSRDFERHQTEQVTGLSGSQREFVKTVRIIS